MSIQKSFVIQNGLEVNNNLIIADPLTNKVGILTDSLKYSLHVNGGIGATDLKVSGISTFNNIILNGGVSVGTTTGIPGQYLISTGLGVTWGTIPNSRVVTSETATPGQITFNISYNVGFIDVYINGIRLSESEFVALNGTSVSLDVACFGGESLDFVTYRAASGNGINGITVKENDVIVGTALSTIVLNFTGAGVSVENTGVAATITIPSFGTTDSINTSGIITAFSFYGDGSNLTGVIASGVAIDLQSNDSFVGTATTINFGTNISVSIDSGIATVTSTGGGGESYWATEGVGIYTGSYVGIGTTNPTEQLTVYGDARITGILTVGTASITLDGNNNEIHVGSGVTIYGDTGELFLNGVQVSASSSFSSLSDVNVSAAETGKALIYNEGQWINGPIIGGIPGIATSSNADSTLLILGDGISGDSTFVDSSIVGSALTAIGSGVSFSDAQSEFGSTSIYFDGTSYIEVQVSTGVTFAAYEDFTLEFWSYQTNTNGYQSIIMWDDGEFEGFYITDGYLNWYEWNDFTGNTYITEDTWHHIAVTRQGNTLRYYVDGILDRQGTGFGEYSYSGYAAIGVNGNRNDEYFEGYLDGINFVKGAALYTGNFLTVPTAEFTTPISFSGIIGGLPYTIKNFDDVSDDTPINYQALVWDGSQYSPGIVYPNGNIFVGTNSDCCTSYNNNFFGTGAGFNNTSGNYNNFFGYHAGDGGGNCTNSFGLCAGGGENNNFFGHYAGSSNSTGEHNNFSGEESGRWNTTGSTNNFFGYQAGGSNTSGSKNIFIGDRAGYCNNTGSENIYMGYLSGGFSGNCTVAFGCESGANNAGCNNHFFGVRSGVYNGTGSYNNFLGAYSGHFNTIGSNNNYIGGFTGGSTAASYRIILGQGKKGNTFFNNIYFDSPDTTKDKQFAVGINTSGTSEYWLVGNENFNIGIGTTNPQTKLEINGVLGFGTFIVSGVALGTNIKIGDNTTGASITDGHNNIFMGIGAGNSTTTGCHNNFLGKYAGLSNTTGSSNNFLGFLAGRLNTSGGNNNFFGVGAGCNNDNGANNNFFGLYSGYNNTTGNYNNFLGYCAGFYNTSANGNNVIGSYSGYNNTTGAANVMIGAESGTSNTTGSYNNFFGGFSGYLNSTGSYNSYFGGLNGISTSASYRLILGQGSTGTGECFFDSPDTTKDKQFAVGINTSGTSEYWLVGNENFNIGIGTTTPTSKLTVGGDALISGIVTASQFISTGDITVGANLNINGNISIGGTTLIFNSDIVQIKDRDIVLGFTTDSSNNEISSDITANHGGIAVASTEGNPILNIPLQVGINSNPTTYKQFMWIKQGNYSGMGTDAWVSNYAISIGNTSTVANGSRLTVGAGFTVYDNLLYTSNINAGVITATTLDVSGNTRVKGFIESQNTSSISNNILSLDATQGTVFTHTTSANIGIVSFTGISTSRASTQTFTVLVTQGAVGYNTTAATGIGTQLATVVTEGGVGYSTHIKVGGGTTMTLTNTAGALDILTFIVSYNGNVSISNTSFTVVGMAATNFRGVI